MNFLFLFGVLSLLQPAIAILLLSHEGLKEHDCFGIRQECDFQYLSINLYRSGMVAGSVTIRPEQDLNDTAFVVLRFGEKDMDNLEFTTRTIYGLNNNLINPEGIPILKDKDTTLVIHKDFMGYWATERDRMFYESMPSGKVIPVYLSIITLNACPDPEVEAYESHTLGCITFSLTKP